MSGKITISKKEMNEAVNALLKTWIANSNAYEQVKDALIVAIDDASTGLSAEIQSKIESEICDTAAYALYECINGKTKWEINDA